MAKYLTTLGLKDFSQRFEKKILREVGEDLEVTNKAIEDIGSNIDELASKDEKEIAWLNQLANDQEDFEKNLIEIDNNVHNLRLFTFFSFLMNVILFIIILAAGII